MLHSSTGVTGQLLVPEYPVLLAKVATLMQKQQDQKTTIKRHNWLVIFLYQATSKPPVASQQSLVIYRTEQQRQMFVKWSY